MSATPAPQQPPPTSGPSSTAAKSGVPVARPARQFFRVHADPDDLLTPRRVSRWIVIAGLLFSSVVHTLIIVILMFLVFGGSGQKGNSVLDMDLTNPGDVLDFTRAEDLDEPLNAPNMEITAAQDIPTQPEITEPLLTDREGPGPGPSPKVAADASAFKVTRIGNNAEQLQGVKIKVGDPQFTLIWNTKADLDLHVREPGGAEIYWSSRKGKLGGELDVDDVDGFGPENIFWNKRVSESGVTVLGQGPPGKYQWFVRYYGGYAGFSQPTRWKVRVKHNGKETVHEGQLKRIGERSKVFTLTNGDSGGPDAGDAAVENPAESVPDTVMDAANADNPDNPDKPQPDQPKPDRRPIFRRTPFRNSAHRCNGLEADARGVYDVIAMQESFPGPDARDIFGRYRRGRMSQTITIVLNGSERDCPAGRTIAALLADLVLKPEHVAVERNQDLVPRSRFAETPLLPGDVIEIVTLVGGG